MSLEKQISGQLEYYMLRYGPIFKHLVRREDGNAPPDYAERMAEELSYVLAESKVITESGKGSSGTALGNNNSLYFTALENLFSSYSKGFGSPRASYQSTDADGNLNRENKVFNRFLKNIEPYQKKGLDKEFFEVFAEGLIDYVRALHNKKALTSFKDKTDSFFSLLDSYLRDNDENYLKSPAQKRAISNMSASSYQRYDFKDFVGDDSLAEDIKKLCNALLLYSPEEKANPLFVPKALIFSGPPGTGKTMMARIMMHYLKHNCSKLGMKFTPCVVDSSIKDKWYGESEKKLKADFAKVKNPEGIGMMVFDEADAIFSPESNGSLEGSLRGLLLGELEGLSDNEKGNFFSVFITNKPYSGIESALHSRSREFYFKPFEDEASYSKLLDNIFQKSLGDALKQGENKHYDFSEVGKLCLKKQLSGRDVRKAVEGYITQKILLDFPPDLFKQGYEKKKRYFKKRLQNISEREILDYFNNFVEEKSQYEKNEQENAILEMAQRKTWQLISDELARQNMDNLGGKETSYDS